MNGDSAGSVYAVGAPVYRAAGWHGVLPLHDREKRPGVGGFTGYDGRWPTEADTTEWRLRWPNRNLGLRVEHGFLALDVDAYEGKTGAATLAEAKRRWGPLPPNYRSTARRDDPTSGQQVYRVTPGILFRSEITFPELKIGHIDTIQPHLRLMAAWPSIHPKIGEVYRWYAPDGSLLPEGVVPCPDEFPELPPKWVEGLAKDALRDEVFDGSAPNRRLTQRDRINEELYQKLIGLQDNQATPDRLVEARLETALADLTSGAGSRYDSTRDHVAALMRMQDMGRGGVPSALRQLYRAYVLEVGDTRPAEAAESEFLRFTQGAAMLIAATPASDPRTALGMPQSAEGGATTTDADVHRDQPSWGRVDLTRVLAGERHSQVPTLLERTDGVCLLYPGLVHSFHGESESGKSLIIQVECVGLINRGEDVLYLDFESDEDSVVDRLLVFGADPHLIDKHFDYRHPEVKPDSPEEQQAWNEILSSQYTLAVIDGVTDALGVFGYSTKDNDDVSRWLRAVPKLIAARTGAAVVLIDHVVKDSSSRGRYAIGGQAKMAGLTGAAYTVEVALPLGKEMRGEVVLRVGKDRPGSVRVHGGTFRKSDRTQEAARIIIDSTVDPPTVTIEPPGSRSDENSGGPNTFRPTNLMQRVSEVLENSLDPLTKTAAAEQAGGNRQAAMAGFDRLVEEGYVAPEDKWSGRTVFVSVKPYRETDDPRSDKYSSTEPLSPLRRVQ